MPVDSAAVLAGYLYNTQWNQSSDARANPAPDDCELSMEELKATNLAEKKYIKQRKDILPGVPVAPALSQIGDDLFKAFQSRDSKQILPWLSTQALILFKTNTFSIEFDNGFAVALNQDNGEITFDAQGSADILTTWSLALVPNLVPCLSGVPAQSGVGSEPKKVAVKSCMKTMTKDGKIISVPTVFVFENALYDEKLPRKITQILLSPNSPVSETTYPQAELNQAIDRLVKAGKIKPK
jgi:hypothetical protein